MLQLMQGLCRLDTVLERVTSEDELDKADAGRRTRTRKDSFSKNREQIKNDSAIDGLKAVRRKGG